MSIDRHYFKQGDTGRPLVVYLEDDVGTPQDLTNCTVTFSMRTKSVTPVSKIINGACDILVPLEGKVQYTFTDEDVDTLGTFEGKWTVTLLGGEKISWPALPKPNDWNQIIIQPGIS